MQPRFVDLHTHTTASDGTDAPRDLIRRAASLKLAAVAVTDHDTVSGLDEAEAAGREYGVEIIRGCELGVQGQYGEIHLLGLWLPRHSAPLDAELARLRGHREERNLKILDRLRSIGINIGYQEVLDEAGGESVGRPHIARVLQKRGIVSNFAQAFELYLGYYGAAYVPRTLLTPEEGVSLMADLGAVVSFAHPMLIRCPPSWFDEIIPRLKEAGQIRLQALSLPKGGRTPHSQAWENLSLFAVGGELAARYGLGLSGGSDYHGMAKPGVELGRGKGGLRVTVALLDALKARRKRPVDDAPEVL